MAKDVKSDDKPADWSPDQPLPDADDEAETTRVAQATARRRYLEEQHLGRLKDPKKEKSGKERKSIFGG